MSSRLKVDEVVRLTLLFDEKKKSAKISSCRSHTSCSIDLDGRVSRTPSGLDTHVIDSPIPPTGMFHSSKLFFFQSDANIQQQHTVCRVNLVNLDRKLAGEVSFITIIVPRIVARSNSTFAFSLSRSHIGAKTKKQFRRKVKTLVDFVSRLKLVSLVGKYTEVGEDTKTKKETQREARRVVVIKVKEIRV